LKESAGWLKHQDFADGLHAEGGGLKMIDILLEEKESQSVHHYCLATDSHRYDFTFIYSNQFFGKAMVISFQTERMALMCQEDLDHEQYWVERLGIRAPDVGQCKTFLEMRLSQKPFFNQY
jgi:hypothetical protein